MVVHPGGIAWRVAAVEAGDDGKITGEQICSLPPSGEGGGGCSTDRPGQTGVSESCLQLRALAAHKDLAWEDSSASKEVLGSAQVELAGISGGGGRQASPGPQREARFQRPVRETPGDTAPCWA